MENHNQKSNAGKGLGVAAFIVSLVAIVMSFIPCLGLFALIPGFTALILAVLAFFQAKKGNGAKGLIISALIISIFGSTIACLQLALVNEIQKSSAKQLDYIGKYHNGYAPAKKYQKWGFVDTNKNIKVDFIYDSIKEYSDGMYAVRNKFWGYVNENLELILDTKYNVAFPFYSGHAIVNLPDDFLLYCCIDKKGNIVSGKFELEEQIGCFLPQENSLYYKVKEKKEYKYHSADEIDTSSIFPRYACIFKNKSENFISSWYKDVCYTKNADSCVWVYDKLGWVLLSYENKLISEHYKDVRIDSVNKPFIVQLGKKHALMNKRGKIISDWYNQMGVKSIDTLKNVKRGIGVGDFYLALVTVGASLLTREEKYDDIVCEYFSSFSEGLMVVRKNSKYGYINTDGKLVISCKYSDAEDFINGTARVSENGRDFMINKEGVRL